ncbi:MAG TPA: class I SAM-dependent methyltransferase [Gammaproteobacteria bacterium]|jgi:SAM-dependent methyltransferase
MTSGNGRFVTRSACELCGAARSRTLLARPMTDAAVWEFLEAYYEGRIAKTALDGAEYRILLCEECGFVWQGEVLAADAMRVLYREWISAEDSLNKKRFGAAALFSEYASQARRIAELIGKPPHETDVLDFGMGWGYWCRMARAFGYRVTGLEVAEDRRAHAQSMGIRVIDALPGGNGGHFDFINAEQVFEHITDPLATARELSRVLRPRGVVRIAVPDAEAAIRGLADPGWKARKDALHPLEHINGFTHETLVRLGEAAGLQVEQPAAETRGLRRLLAVIAGRLSGPPRSGTCLFFRKAG